MPASSSFHGVLSNRRIGRTRANPRLRRNLMEFQVGYSAGDALSVRVDGIRNRRRIFGFLPLATRLRCGTALGCAKDRIAISYQWADAPVEGRPPCKSKSRRT